MPMQSPTLRDMIQQAQKNGASLRDLQARAIDPLTGRTAGKDTISSIAKGTANRIPEPHHLRAIAAALNISYEEVRQAAIAQWLPPVADEEAERERLELLAQAKRLRDQANETIARLERQERDEEQDGGRRAG